MAKTDITKLAQDVAWQDVTRGNTIVGCGTTREFVTGDWTRSEERRVGKECRSRWSPYH